MLIPPGRCFVLYPQACNVLEAVWAVRPITQLTYTSLFLSSSFNRARSSPIGILMKLGRGSAYIIIQDSLLRPFLYSYIKQVLWSDIQLYDIIAMTEAILPGYWIFQTITAVLANHTCKVDDILRRSILHIIFSFHPSRHTIGL